MHTTFLSKNLKKRENVKGLRVDRKIILKRVVNKYGVHLIYVAEAR